jgi:hypothetical protein
LAVKLPANRIDRLGDIFGRAGIGPLEQHVLDKVRDAAALIAFVPRPAHQPHPDGDRTHVGHGFRDQAQTVVENVANNHALRRLVRHSWSLRDTSGPAAGRPRSPHRMGT